MIVLRDYQEQAVAAVYEHLRQTADHPLVVLPTGAGKSAVIARLCHDAATLWGGRVLVLAHVKELLGQCADKIRQDCPTLAVGLYSAGLGRRDTAQQVIVAGVQSVYARGADLGHFDLLVIDEVHLVPGDGEGRYRTLIDALVETNPDLRVVGLTATPYRTAGGLIYGDDRLFKGVCYEAKVRPLVQRGFLCRLVGKAAVQEVSAAAVPVVRGEYDDARAEAEFTADGRVRAAAAEVVERTAGRRAVMLFCQSVAHARQVAGCLRAELRGREDLAAAETRPAWEAFALDPADPLADHRLRVVHDWLMDRDLPTAFLGEWLARDCPAVEEVYGDTPPKDRDRVVAAFKAGRVRYLVNVGVLTTGFDAPQVDCVCLLRMTTSAGLYYQMVGRGFRPHPDKADCLVLDFGENIKRHGPVDAIRVREKKKGERAGAAAEPGGRMCPACRAVLAPTLSVCTECGAEFEAVARAAHHGTADADDPLSGRVRTEREAVEGVEYRVHRKKDAPDTHPRTLRVTYRLGVGRAVSEWVCVEHQGFAGQKAVRWWRGRCRFPMPDSAAAAAAYADHGLLAPPTHVTLKTKSGEKYPEIEGVELGDVPDAPAPCPTCRAVNRRVILPNADPRYPGRVVCGQCRELHGYACPDTVARFGLFDQPPGNQIEGLLPLKFDEWADDLDEDIADGPRDSEEIPDYLPEDIPW